MLSAYYLRAHMYTCVPAQIRQDMQWMADVGTDGVVVAVLEQDLAAALENLHWIADEAERAGMKLWAVPSRWGGLGAGAPKVPSLWASMARDAWMLKADGEPHGFMGPLGSVHHPATCEFFCRSLEKLLDEFPVAGIIWDEPKALDKLDYSAAARDAARESGKDVSDAQWQTQAFVGFFDGLNAFIKERRPRITTAMFVYGHLHERYELLTTCAAQPHLDQFGLDGRPWSRQEDGAPDQRDENRKSLLDQGPAFLQAAREAGKQSLALIENHNCSDAATALIDRRMPDVLAMGFDHLLYYYYPRAVESPERQMQVLARHLRPRFRTS